jgi:nicotinamide riboside kinase
MAYVGVHSITSASPSSLVTRQPHQFNETGFTTAIWEDGTLTVHSVGEGFVVAAAGDPIVNVWTHVVVSVVADIPGNLVARLNRLLAGTGAPKVEWYFRSGSVTLNMPGKRVALPVTFSIKGNLVEVLNGPDAGRSFVVPGAAPTPVVATVEVLPSPAAVAIATIERLGGGTVADPTIVTTTAPNGDTVTSTPVDIGAAIFGGRNLAPAERVVSIPRSLEPLPTPVVVAADGAVPFDVAPLPAPPAPVVSAPARITVKPAPTGGRDPLGIFAWPVANPALEIKTEGDPKLDAVWRLHTKGKRQTIALTGPSGTGKTSLAYGLAAKVGAPIIKVDAAAMTTLADWVGATAATERNGATVTEWLPSAFIEAVRADGPYAGTHRIVLVDEANRAETSGALNALLPVLDGTGTLYIADARRAIPLDPAVMVILTYNLGAAYSGTSTVDGALKNRVTHWVHVGYPKENVEQALLNDRTGISLVDADLIVRAAAAIRAVASRGEINEGISPRQTLEVAEKRCDGWSLLDAVTFCWVNSYDDQGGGQSDRARVKAAVDGVVR